MTGPDVALIDDDAAVLDSTRLVLQNEGYSVETYESAEAFLTVFDAERAPGCVVSDVRMPGLSGLELQHALMARGVRVPLILITGHGDIGMAVKAIKAGACDFIEKPFDVPALVASIHNAIADGRKSEAAVRARAEMARRFAELSGRQREVMDLVVQGYSNKQIAIELGISARTVETYRLWVMEKTGARNVAELVRLAMMVSGDDAEPAPRDAG